jgi:hypothetical protein
VLVEGRHQFVSLVRHFRIIAPRTGHLVAGFSRLIT